MAWWRCTSFCDARTHARTPHRAHTQTRHKHPPTHTHERVRPCSRSRGWLVSTAGSANGRRWVRLRLSPALCFTCTNGLPFWQSVRGVRQRRPHRVLFLQVHFFDVYDYLNAIDELRKTGIHFSERKPGIKWPAHGVGGTMGNDDGLSQGTSVSDDQGADLRRCAHEN